MSREVGTKAWLLLQPTDTPGRRIRFLRIALGLTQTELAKDASDAAMFSIPLTKSFISLLEADRTQPSVKTLAGVAAVLGTSMDYLWTGEAPRARGKPRIEVRARSWIPKDEVKASGVRFVFTVPRTEIIVRRPTSSGKILTLRVPLSREAGAKARELARRLKEDRKRGLGGTVPR